MALLAFGALLTACKEEEDLGLPKISLDNYEAALAQGEGSTTVQLTATRDWYIANAETLPDWIAVNPAEGKASTQPQTVTVTVNANPGHDRTEDVVFSIGLAKASLTLNQKGAKGEIRMGTGTMEDPFSVAGVIAYVKNLGSDVNSPISVFVSGKVSSIDEAFSTDFGNGTFNISDDGTAASEQFTCYRVKYLGNRSWKASDPQIAPGDDVTIYGNVVNYRGNKPETAQNTAFVYSHNGKSDGGVVDPSDIKASTIADFIAKADGNYSRLTGKVSDFKTGTSSAGKNYMQFNLTDDSGKIVVYGFKDGQYEAWASKIKNGGTAVITGTYELYTNKNTGATQHEVMNCTIESFTEGTDPGPDPGQITSTTVADFIAKASADTYYRLTGTVSEFRTGTTSAGKNYMQFTLTDNTSSIIVYGFKDGEYEKWADKIKDYGTAVINGTYQLYTNKNTGAQQHEVMNCTVESFTEGSAPDPGTPSGNGTVDNPYNVAGVIQYIDSSSYSEDAEVYVKGKICSIKNTFDANYGTAIFNISDDGSTSSAQFTCYSIYYLENKSWVNGYTQIKNGDEVIAYGKVVLYNGSIYETSSKNAYIYSLNGATVAEEVDNPDPDPGTDTDFTSNVTWTDGSDASYTQEANVNGTAGVSILKLGTGSKYGKSTITFTGASSKLTFYAVSWNNVDVANLVFTVDGNEVATVTPKANSGLKGNPVYTITVTDSDKYSVDLPSGTTSVTVETSGGYRAALFAIKAE